jgi:hypothetical protein
VLIGSSAQAQTLTLAAQSATPFCEECEKKKSAASTNNAANEEPSTSNAPPLPNRSLLDQLVDEANKVAAPGGSVTDSQRAALRGNLPVVMRRNQRQNQAARQDFNRTQQYIIRQWEQKTGRSWPQGATPHHIVPLESGGSNKWYNIMPTHGALPNHSLPQEPGPHASGSLLRQTVQRGRRQLPPGTTTDLRRPYP